jgi:hypothetical protein
MLIKDNEISNLQKMRSMLHLLVLSILTVGITLSIIFIHPMILGEFRFNTVPESIYAIEISESSDFSLSSTTLEVESYLELAVSYTVLKLDDILSSQGQFIDSDYTYMSYSFYMKNTGNKDVTVYYYMRFVEWSHWMQDNIRILVILDNQTYKLYQKSEDSNLSLSSATQFELSDAINFESNIVAFTDEINLLRPNQVRSFRVIIWLESSDKDYTDEYSYGRIKTLLTFGIKEPNENTLRVHSSPLSQHENLWISPYQRHYVTFDCIYQKQDD